MSDENGDQSDGDRLTDDEMLAFVEKNDITTNDAVAGETVEPGPGSGNDGPTGGSPREFEPELDEHGGVGGSNDAPADLDDGGEIPDAGPVRTTTVGDGGGRRDGDADDVRDGRERDE